MNKIWIFGLHACLAALSNPDRICHEILLTNQNKNIVAKNNNKKMLVRITDNKEISKVAGHESVHQGIAMRVDLLPNKTLEHYMCKENSLVVILDQITDPRNLGAILRAAAAFQVDCVIAQNHNSAQETGVLAKAASGGLDIVPICRVINIAKSIEILKKHGYWIYGLDCSGSLILQQEIPAKKSAIVLGSEGSGMRSLVKKSCDITLRINTAIESLNVSMAAGIAMHHFSAHTYDGRQK